MTNTRIKVDEFRDEGALVEVYRKELDGKVYFDVSCSEAREDQHQDFFIRSCLLPSLIICVVRAMEYVSVQHREIRRDGGDSSPRKTNFANWTQEEGGMALVKVWEVKVDFVMVEVFQGDPLRVRCSREHTAQGDRTTSGWIQQRDLRALVIALAQAQKFIERQA